jgi:hypothetical protein
MKNLELEQMQRYSYSESSQSYGDSSETVANFGYSTDYLALAEGVQSQIGEMFSYPGIASRGFSWADDSFSAHGHSANFAGMDSASVVSTGSWSSPSKDFAAIVQLNRHAVSGFDVFDFAPANSEFLDGVRNGYALVEEENCGFVNHKVDNATYAGGPNGGDYTAAPAAGEPRLNIQTENQNQNYGRTYGAAFGSEEFGIGNRTGHEVMVSQESGDSRE